MPLSRRLFLSSALASLALPRMVAASDDELSVVATTGMIADTARRIGGDLISVKALMGPGVDPHSYRQTRTDIAAMSRADLVLANGLHLEAQMEEFLEALTRRVPVDKIAEVLPNDQLLDFAGYEGRHDPHVWMAPTLWSTVAGGLADALIRELPNRSSEIDVAKQAFQSDLSRLDTYAREVISSIPEGANVLVSAHDAFSYFGRAYGMEVVGIQGISTESEAGLNRISELVALLAERQIQAVFVESSVSDRNIRALIEGAAARGHSVKIGGELYSDAMGSPGTYEGTYLGMIDHNVTTIARALGGQAPETGLDGKLTGHS